MSSINTAGLPVPDWGTREMEKRVSKRHRRNGRLRYIGMAGIATALGLLAILLVSLSVLGYQAFSQTKVAVDIYIDPARVDQDNLRSGEYRGMLKDGLLAAYPAAAGDRALEKSLQSVLTRNAHYILRDYVMANPAVIGTTIRLPIQASDPVDQFHKGVIDRSVAEDDRIVKDRQIAIYDALVADGWVSQPFNWELFFWADSRYPELAGMAGALVGSFFALIVVLLLSVPIGVATAVYLEEFAPKGRFSDIVEVNINNLAAVPSVVFGLLGLAVFLGFFGMPRSAPLVGGMVLSLMTLPTIIIATRAALKAIPPSIREAALGVGASKHQMILHHVLPLAFPGIMTGTIIGLAQALGETAPLLLIGMNAFITAPPGDILSPSTALPTQIFIWSDSPERGFLSRTAGAILVLLGFLITMNAIAIYLRNKFERTW